MPTGYLNETEKKRGRHHMLVAELFNGFASTLLGETIIFLLASHFGAGNIALGYISSALYMSGIILPIVPRLIKGYNMERLHGLVWGLRGLVSVGYVALFFLTGNAAVALLVIVYTLFCIFRVVGIVLNDYSMKSISSLQNRGSVFANISVGYNETSIVAKVLSFLVTSLKSLAGLVGLIGLQMFGVITNMVASWQYSRIPCRRTITYNPKRSMFVMMKESMKDPAMAMRIWIKWIFQTAAIVLGMTVPFMTNELNLASNFVMLYTVFAGFALALSGVICRKFADRMGSRPLVFISSIMLIIIICLWIILPASISPIVFMGLGVLYNFLINLILLLVNRVVSSSIPDDEAVTFNSMVNFGLGVTALLGGLIAGWLVDLGSSDASLFQIGNASFGNTYTFTFFFALVLVVLGTVLSWKLKEQGSLTTSEAAHALFSMHGLRAFSTIERLNKTNDPIKRKILLLNLGGNLARVATGEIRATLASPFSTDKQDYIRALAERPRNELVKDVAAIAMDDDSYVQMDAIATLGSFKDSPVARDALIKLLDCRWSQVRSMAAKSLSRITNASEFLPRITELSHSARHIDEEIDFLVAKRNMDPTCEFLQDFFVPVTQGRSASFRQTRYALIASFLKFGSPRLASLYALMNNGGISNFLTDFLTDARDLEEIDSNYDNLFSAFENKDWSFLISFCLKMASQSNVVHDKAMENLRQGILLAKEMDQTAFDVQDILSMLYFCYSLKKNSR